MDYSQFLIMRGEISLLLVFLLIFLFDTFGGKKSLKGLSITACVYIFIYLTAVYRNVRLLPRSFKFRINRIGKRQKIDPKRFLFKVRNKRLVKHG